MKRILVLALLAGVLVTVSATSVAATPSNSDWFERTAGYGGLSDGEVGWGFEFDTQEDGQLFVALLMNDGEEHLCFEGEAQSWIDRAGTIAVDLPPGDLGCDLPELVGATVSLDYSATVQKSDVWVNGRPCENSEWNDDSAAPSLLLVSAGGAVVDLHDDETFVGSYFMSTQHCPGNPFVGSWENIDPADDSNQRLQIADSGRFQYRDDFASGCESDELDTAFRATGTGEFVEESSPIFVMIGDGFCGKTSVGLVDAEFQYERPDRLRMSDDSCWYRSGSDPTICDAEINDELQCQAGAGGLADLTVNNIGTVDLDLTFTVGDVATDTTVAGGASHTEVVSPHEPWSWVATYNGLFIDGQDGEGPPCAEISELLWSVALQCDETQSQIVLTNDSPPERSIFFQAEVEGDIVFEGEVEPSTAEEVDVPSQVRYSWQIEYQGFPVEHSAGSPDTLLCPGPS
jgi:hypothetical protein